MASVLQSWLEQIPIRMQSTLILGLRGPDTHRAPEVKKIGRWLRGVSFRPGNPDNALEFIRDEAPDRIHEKGPAARELEFCSQHYFLHLMHALEVVGYCHPCIDVAQRAHALFCDMCALMHLPAETLEEFERRLGTREWPCGGQPNDVHEAVVSLGLARTVTP